jgi:hypothetical protein
MYIYYSHAVGSDTKFTIANKISNKWIEHFGNDGPANMSYMFIPGTEEGDIDLNPLRHENGHMAKGYIIKRERARLKDLIDNGLPPCYDSFQDYLCDFYPDFSWNENSIHELRFLVNDMVWLELAAQLSLGRGYNFINEVLAAIKQLEDDGE